MKSVAHVKPFRKDISPEEQEHIKMEYFQRLSGERNRKTNELRNKKKHPSSKTSADYKPLKTSTSSILTKLLT